MQRNRIKEKKSNTRKIGLKTIMILTVLAAVIVFAGVYTISYIKKSKENERAKNMKVDSKEIITKNTTKKQQGEFEVTNVNISSGGNLTNVSATVKNNDNKKYKSISVNIVFYDSNKKQVAVAKGLIENINVGEQKSFSSYITGDYTQGSNYEVQIGNIGD